MNGVWVKKLQDAVSVEENGSEDASLGSDK
jgi:hypothetical protein